MNCDVERLLRGGVVARTTQNAGVVGGLVRRGRLVRLLPGVYCIPGTEADPSVRARAVMAHDPDSVLLGAFAAAVTWWPELTVHKITTARGYLAAPADGFQWVRREIPADLVVDVDGLRVSCPALTVLDLLDCMGGCAIDEALRRRVVTLAQLHEALEATAYRRGNAQRATLLHDSRDAPWSAAERLAHRHFRRAGVTGWVANHRVIIPGPPPSRLVAYLDIAFPELMLGLEIDGYAYHVQRAQFERDRARDLALARAGWQIVRFSASTMDDAERFVASVRDLIAQRSTEIPQCARRR